MNGLVRRITHTLNKDWKEVRDQAAWTPERGPLEKDRCAEEQQAGQCGCSKETEAEGRQGTASERPRGPAVGDLAAHSGLCFSLSGEMVLNREVTRSDLSFQRIVQAAVLRKDSRRPGLKSVGVGVCARPSEVCPQPPPPAHSCQGAEAAANTKERDLGLRVNSASWPFQPFS